MSQIPKVLIVEDDGLLLKAMQLQFERSGFKVRAATDGEQALKQLKTWIPSDVVLDILMPKKDGFEVLEAIKNNPVLKGMPVIIASNLSREKDQVKGLKLSAAEYIVKSDLSLAELVSKTAYHIGMSAHGRKSVA